MVNQNWPKYNEAKCKEKRLFYELLADLVKIVPEPIHQTGRKPAQIKDLLFSACLKIYSNYSSRKISSDLEHAKKMAYIDRKPHFNTLLKFMNNKFTQDLLQYLITVSAMPLSVIEEDFSLDSSGFGSYQYERWQRAKWGKMPKRGWRNYVKCHIAVGTMTNVITAAEVTYGNLHDTKQLPKLVAQTSKNFNAKKYSADKAYLSNTNMRLIASYQAMPFIMFKKDSTRSGCKMWNHMYDYFTLNKEEFMRNYHRRSNVESTFCMIKMRLGEFLKSKNHQAQINEVLLKCLVHNICCLIQEIFERNIDINFKKCASCYVAHK